MRPVDELIDVHEPAWPLVLEWVGAAANTVEVLPPSTGRAEALHAIQVTTRSPMGAVVYQSGGLLVDHGWVRVLGSGCSRLPRSLPRWNEEVGVKVPDQSPPILLVADDVAGGFFAINGGGLDGPRGAAFYLAPDTLNWEEVAPGYSALLQFFLQGDLARFYADLRWNAWAEEAAALGGDEAFSIYPFLWAEGPPIEERSRRAVPVRELWSLALEMRSRLVSA